jgi:phenylalanyl-tRNA synthetase beta chain
MKVSYSWMKEFVDVPVDAGGLAHALEIAGDTLMDFEVTVNRPDCLSVFGLARETAAIFHLPPPQLPPLQQGEDLRQFEGNAGTYSDGPAPLAITLEDPDLCPRYCGQIFTGVRVAPSPDWLRKKLEAGGLRSINNIVDITNLVLLELGQPLHAFDYRKLAGGAIRVRRARNGEKLMMIDGRERRLADTILAIADAERPQAVAGVMGGMDSEVSDTTDTLLLESAYFQPTSVRKTARALELSTDASYRFERGADPNLQAIACRRAAFLFEQLAGARAHAILDVRHHLPQLPRVHLRPERVERVLGLRIDPAFIREALTSLHFREVSDNLWEAPSFRVDISREIDLIEEVARLYGYNRFPDTLPAAERKYQNDYPTYALEQAAGRFLQAASIDEACTFSLIDPSSSRLDAKQERYRLKNPVAETASELRTSLIPGLLDSVDYNLRHKNERARLYEIGRVFPSCGEHIALGIVITGDFLDLKGVIEGLLSALNYPAPEIKKKALVVGDQVIGSIDTAGVEGTTVQACEIMLDLLNRAERKPLVYVPIVTFPSVERDASFILNEAVPYSRLMDSLRKLQIPELRTCKLLDRYRGKNIPAGKISITLRFVFQSPSCTLTSEEVDLLYAKIITEFTSAVGAEARK